MRLSDLKGESVISLADPSIFSFRGSSLIGQLDRHQVAISTPLSGIACSLVACGAGVAIVDPFSVLDYLDRGVVARPFEPRVDIRMAIVTSSHRRLSSLSREFIEAFRGHAEATASRFADTSARRVQASNG